jgi:hypothetical protein
MVVCTSRHLQEVLADAQANGCEPNDPTIEDLSRLVGASRCDAQLPLTAVQFTKGHPGFRDK